MSVFSPRVVPELAGKKVAAAGGRLLMIGAAATKVTTDGSTWTSASLPSSGNWARPVFGADTFVTIRTGYGMNTAATSTDGTSWSAATMPTAYWGHLAFESDLFLALSKDASTSAIATSPDGVTWTQRSSPFRAWFTHSLAAGNGVFVAIDTASPPLLRRSTNGTAWTSSSLPTHPFGGTWYQITFSGGVFALHDDGGYGVVFTSVDGLTWDLRTTPPLTSGSLGRIIFVAGGGKYMLAPDLYGSVNNARNDIALMSSDLSSWEEVVIPYPGDLATDSVDQRTLTGFAHFDGYFIGFPAGGVAGYEYSTTPPPPPPFWTGLKLATEVQP